MDRERLEAQLAAFPLYAYAFIKPDELVFSDRVRYICAHECPRYNTSWACPPAVGTMEECRLRLTRFPEGLMIATIAEADDVSEPGASLPAREDHERITREIRSIVLEQASEAMTLSAGSCARCARCAWPDAPCRHPESMSPCIESHGVLVTDLAERHGVDFMAGGNLVTWFSLILYR